MDSMLNKCGSSRCSLRDIPASKKKRPQEARPEAVSLESGVRVSVVSALHRSESSGHPARQKDSTEISPAAVTRKAHVRRKTAPGGSCLRPSRCASQTRTIVS